MIDPNNVPAVTAEEMLARFIFQSSHIRPSDGSVKPNAFMPAPDLLCSVTRHLHATENEIWSVAQGLAKRRSAVLHGSADVTAEICFNHGLAVKEAPVADNPNHANVANWPSDKAMQKVIALAIASAAGPARRPPT